MSDLTEWVKERRRIHDAATEGPWKQDEEDGVRGVDLYTNTDSEDADDRWERQDADIRTWDADDATAIVDAHNTLPALLTAVEKVLELHEPIEGFGGDPSHWECSVCGDEYGPMKYPCPTIRAIEGAINE